jgi:Alcohol dehydrogenase transcription factor Myb/SANT-like.
MNTAAIYMKYIYKVLVYLISKCLLLMRSVLLFIVSVPYCKEKWKNLRCVFVRKLKPSPAGFSKKSSKPYYLSRFMSFILPYIKTNSVCDDMSGNVPSPTQHENDDARTTTDFSEPSKQQGKYTDNDQIQPVKKQKLKLYEPDKSTERLQARGMENTSTNENARKMFLLSLLPEINDMTENQMKIFRRKVLQLIDEINNVPCTSD